MQVTLFEEHLKAPSSFLIWLCHEFFMAFPIITFFRRAMSVPLWEASLCPAWLTRKEIPQLQLRGKKQNRYQTGRWGTTRTPAGEVNGHFWSPITCSDEKRVHVATFIGGSPETGLGFGTFSIIQHTLSLSSELQMLLWWIVQWWNKERVSEWPPMWKGLNQAS